MKKINIINDFRNLIYDAPIYRKHEDDGGYDVRMPYNGIIMPHRTACIGLGIHIETPKGQACMTIPRSSTAKRGLVVHTAIIDAGYTGEIHLIMTNTSNKPIRWQKGDRLISLVFFYINNKLKVNYVTKLKETHRGNDGLGSSGK